LALVFTGDEFGDGADTISKMLKKQGIKASFFLTGRYYRNPEHKNHIKQLIKHGHYMGCHSDQHVLYCDWDNRDSLLISKADFFADITNNYEALQNFGILKKDAIYFLPPYEWYNDTISVWTKESGLQLVNFTPGTKSTSDYTYPEMKSYHTCDEIYLSVTQYEKTNATGLNGFILLVHIGTDPRRKDKFYFVLPKLITYLSEKGYRFITIDELLSE